MSEFAARFVFGLRNIASFRGLIKELRKGVRKKDELTKEFLCAEGEDGSGWLATFTAYRNLFTHSAPMEQASGITFAIQDQLSIADNCLAPQLYYPLPANIRTLLKERSSGPVYRRFDDLVSASAGRKSARESEPDALEYLHTILGRMAALGEKLMHQSPIRPEVISLNDSDLVGPVRVIKR